MLMESKMERLRIFFRTSTVGYSGKPVEVKVCKLRSGRRNDVAQPLNSIVKAVSSGIQEKN